MKSKVLLVDDQAEFRSILGKAFETSGYEVEQASSGEQLKTFYKESQPDVVVLDLKLPDADGLDLLTEIKREWADTEVIVLTGHASLEAAVEATKRGAFHFQTKPQSEGLFNLVERALERKQQAQPEKCNQRKKASHHAGAACTS